MLDHIRVVTAEPVVHPRRHRPTTLHPHGPSDHGVTEPVGPQADHDQGWQRERRHDREDGCEQADGGKRGLCP